MKMNPADFKILKESIEPLITKEIIDQYETGNFSNSQKTKDLNKRFRWDLYFYSIKPIDFYCEYDDSHIDTALKKIVPTIERKF